MLACMAAAALKPETRSRSYYPQKPCSITLTHSPSCPRHSPIHSCPNSCSFVLIPASVSQAGIRDLPSSHHQSCTGITLLVELSFAPPVLCVAITSHRFPLIYILSHHYSHRYIYHYFKLSGNLSSSPLHPAQSIRVDRVAVLLSRLKSHAVIAVSTVEFYRIHCFVYIYISISPLYIHILSLPEAFSPTQRHLLSKSSGIPS